MAFCLATQAPSDPTALVLFLLLLCKAHCQRRPCCFLLTWFLYAWVVNASSVIELVVSAASAFVAPLFGPKKHGKSSGSKPLSGATFRKIAKDAAKTATSRLGCKVSCEYLGQRQGEGAEERYEPDPSRWLVPEGHWRSQQDVYFRWVVDGVTFDPQSYVSKNVLHRGVRRSDDP